MLNYVWFFLAALFEIAGCYAFWMWLRLDRSAWWIVPGLLSLALFALILTRVEAAFAGRAYDDNQLLSLAAAFEATGSKRQVPPRTPPLVRR
mgnify:CR=1 FL=1